MAQLQALLGEDGVRWALWIGLGFAALLGLLLLIFIVRRIFAPAFNLSSSSDRRGRPPRLGVTDFFNLDRAGRRLVIVRRDNVEHLVLVGGPNDVLIESNIVRGVRPDVSVVDSSGRPIVGSRQPELGLVDQPQSRDVVKEVAPPRRQDRPQDRASEQPPVFDGGFADQLAADLGVAPVEPVAPEPPAPPAPPPPPPPAPAPPPPRTTRVEPPRIAKPSPPPQEPVSAPAVTAPQRAEAMLIEAEPRLSTGLPPMRSQVPVRPAPPPSMPAPMPAQAPQPAPPPPKPEERAEQPPPMQDAVQPPAPAPATEVPPPVRRASFDDVSRRLQEALRRPQTLSPSAVMTSTARQSSPSEALKPAPFGAPKTPAEPKPPAAEEPPPPSAPVEAPAEAPVTAAAKAPARSSTDSALSEIEELDLEQEMARLLGRVPGPKQ